MPDEGRTFLSRVTCVDEYADNDASHALISIGPEFIEWVKTAREHYAAVKKFDAQLLCLEFWDGHCTFIAPVFERWDDEDINTVDDGDNLLLVKTPEEDTYTAVRTEADTIRVYDDGVMWTANLDGTGIALETMRFSWKELGVE